MSDQNPQSLIDRVNEHGGVLGIIAGLIALAGGLINRLFDRTSKKQDNQRAFEDRLAQDNDRRAQREAALEAELSYVRRQRDRYAAMHDVLAIEWNAVIDRLPDEDLKKRDLINGTKEMRKPPNV